MRAADLLNRLEDKLFKPFRIHVSDGTTVDVPIAGMVIVGLSSAVPPDEFAEEDGRRVAARWKTVALAHMVQFTDLDVPASGNGRDPR